MATQPGTKKWKKAAGLGLLNSLPSRTVAKRKESRPLGIGESDNKQRRVLRDVSNILGSAGVKKTPVQEQ